MPAQAQPDFASFLAAWDRAIIHRRLAALYRELTDPMRIKITERTVFQGKIVQPGDVIDGIARGPYRAVPAPGGHTGSYVQQFEVMANETEQEQVIVTARDVAPVTAEALQAVAAPIAKPVAPPAGSFAEATKAVLKPAAPAVRPAGNPLAARVRALTARRAKFQDMAGAVLDQGEEAMTRVETDGPVILQKALDASHDELDAIADLADSLKEASGNQ